MLFILPCNQPFTWNSSVRSIPLSAGCILLVYLASSNKGFFCIDSCVYGSVPRPSLVIYRPVFGMACNARECFSYITTIARGADGEVKLQPLLRAACMFLAFFGQAGGECYRLHASCWRGPLSLFLDAQVHLFVLSTTDGCEWVGLGCVFDLDEQEIPSHLGSDPGAVVSTCICGSHHVVSSIDHGTSACMPLQRR